LRLFAGRKLERVDGDFLQDGLQAGFRQVDARTPEHLAEVFPHRQRMRIVRGDPAAWTDAQAALVKLQRQTTYRVRTAVLGRPTIVDVINPDRFRIRIVGTSTIETVIVGKEARSRVSGGEWRCLTLPNVLPETNPEKWVGEVTASKGGVAFVEGVRVQSYSYTLRVGTGPSGHYRLYVDVATGLPKRLLILEVREDEPETVKSQFDYYDFNAPITIELPSCR